MLTVEAALSAAADLLANRFGGRPELSEPEDLGGSGAALVVRARVAHNPFLQERTVIIKQLPPEALNGPDPALIREIVAYQFTNSLAAGSRPGPLMLAYDLNDRILVTTDAGTAEDLAHTWRASDDAERTALVRRLGVSLGKMHRATAGAEDSFDALFHRMMMKARAGQALFAARDRILVEAIDDGLAMVADIGVEIPPEVSDFAADSARRLVSGQHRAFTPFDLSPDNILCGNRRITYLDFEWAGFRDVTFDLACIISGFPQYVDGDALSGELSDVLINAWRHEVVDIWPNVANNDRLNSRLVTALVGWGLLSLVLLRAGGLTALIVDGWSDKEFPNLLKDRAQSREQLAIRHDVIETFSALRLLAHRGEDPRMPAVEQFADSVVAAVKKLDGYGTKEDSYNS